MSFKADANQTPCPDARDVARVQGASNRAHTATCLLVVNESNYLDGVQAVIAATTIPDKA